MRHKIVYDKWTFETDQIREGNLYLATSLLASSLEVNTLAATVECKDASILDFQRNTQLLYYGQPDRPMVFRLQDVTRLGPDLYELASTSTLGLLTEGQHMGGIYTGQTAEEIIADICGSVPFIVKSNLAKIRLYGWLPIAAPRDNLAQVLFAIGAALKTDLDGILRIEGLWDGISGETGRDDIYTDANVGYSAKVTRVILTEHQYAPGSETEQLFDGTTQQGDIITFDAPMHSLTADGFTVLASGANWARVSAGSGVLTGKVYVHNTRQISRDIWTAVDPNIKTVTDATLVSLVNSSATADRLAAYYRCREQIDAPVIYRGEMTGDRRTVYHPFDKIGVSACLESADINLSGTLKAQEKILVGFVPPQQSGIEYEDHHEVITADGTWTVPAGVDEVTVVCIGGGTGGSGGYNGSSVPASTQAPLEETSSISPTSAYIGYYPGEGCPGGAGGQPGSGGKVYTETIDVEEGQTFRSHVGIGGSGGSSNGGAGRSGGDTTFGSLSSASGASSSNGYTDIVSGIRYATPSQYAGIAGGKGGTSNRVASASDPMNPGGSVRDRYGRTWSPGAIPSPSDRKTSQSGSYYAASGRGMGGGAAAGGNGGSGDYGTAGASNYGARATGGTGGRGGDAVAPPKASVRGGGGDGGHGGGGGGGPGLCGAQVTGTTSTTNLTRNVGSAGPGGSGSAGGQGGDGIIILYYRVPIIHPSGQFVDKNGKTFLDKLTRRFIV